MLGVWQVIAITLKIAGEVDWSWWIVLVPVWTVAIMFAAAFILGAIAHTIMLRKMKKAMDNLTRE